MWVNLAQIAAIRDLSTLLLTLSLQVADRWASLSVLSSYFIKGLMKISLAVSCGTVQFCPSTHDVQLELNFLPVLCWYLWEAKHVGFLRLQIVELLTKTLSDHKNMELIPSQRENVHVHISQLVYTKSSVYSSEGMLTSASFFPVWLQNWKLVL